MTYLRKNTPARFGRGDGLVQRVGLGPCLPGSGGQGRGAWFGFFVVVSFPGGTPDSLKALTGLLQSVKLAFSLPNRGRLCIRSLFIYVQAGVY